MAYIGPHEAACEDDIPLAPGDIVQVITVVEEDDCLKVLVLRGAQAGQIGEVHLDLRAREMKGWRGLTASGSVARAERTTVSRRTSRG